MPKKIHDREIYFAISEKCYCLTSTNAETVTVTEVDALSTSQEEAGTRIILHCLHILQTAPTTTHIVVRSRDTDVFVLMLKYAQDIGPVVLFDTETGNKQRLLNVKQIIEVKGSDVCLALPALHCFTGCETIGVFVRTGKIIPLKARDISRIS